jgi:hypothetical protein
LLFFVADQTTSNLSSFAADHADISLVVSEEAKSAEVS